MALEDAFWSALKDIAASENTSLNTLAPRIDADRQHTNFSSAIRLYVLNHYRRLAEERAGGNGKRRCIRFYLGQAVEHFLTARNVMCPRERGS